MNPRVTIFFVLVLAGLALVVFGLKPGSSTSDFGPTPVPQPTILSLDPTQLTRITINANSKTTEVAAGADGHWYLEPGAQPADEGRILGLVGRLANLRGTSQVTDPGTDLAAYGLAQPTMRVTVLAGDGTQKVVLIGAPTPVGTGHYAKLEDSADIFVVQQLLIEDLQRMVDSPPVPLATPTPRPAVEATPAPPPPTPTLEPTPAN